MPNPALQWIASQPLNFNVRPHGSHMLDISKVAHLNDLRSTTLRERAERGHCAKSKEFLATLNGEEAGLLSYEDWGNKQPGFIYEILVLPSFRRQGVGKFLLAHAESYAVQLGCESILLKPYSLDQEPDQNRLIAWYAREGYCQIRGDQEHMVKNLPTQSAASQVAHPK